MGETQRRRQLISTANVAMQQPIEVSTLGSEMQKLSTPPASSCSAAKSVQESPSLIELDDIVGKPICILSLDGWW